MTKDAKTDPAAAAVFPVGGAVVDSDTPMDDGPMTDKQAVVLRELCEKHGEPMDGNLTRAQADARIAALKEKG